MSAAQLMTDLARLGVHIEAHGDRLRYSPRSAVTPSLAGRMKAHKGELLDFLRGEDTSICCPWCRTTARLIDGRRGIWCTRCERLAWLDGPDGSITRADHAGDSVIDPPEPCEACGGIERWQDGTGRLRCPACDPDPGHSARLRALAERIRATSKLLR